MTDHRVRLSDDDLELVVSALKARLAMTKGKRRQKLQQLIGRLDQMAPGNPHWRLSGTNGFGCPVAWCTLNAGHQGDHSRLLPVTAQTLA